ncbi:conserved phage C-terminal domain-containing protein [Mammaliicoccus sciuri]|uniref:conserved phage C-terminal domain-containing protein n=1 Tax=Mammaliicoccus sciuri TaxID=1296 RepID=UPI00194ED2A6|nr:conserved phage C-terminal domain-containing protein [Mammaliicoccus sciuri]MCJ0953543.1 conserved phage C-terminal domain-containing protein [Mammaliicoccus sciuri]
MKEQPSYYSILTADVRYSTYINDSEKVLFSEITALSNKNGFCSASNKYFAELYNVNKDTISRRINKLKTNGFIDVEIEYKDKQIIKRRIYPLSQINRGIVTNQDRGISNSHGKGILSNHVENNTSNNTTRLNNTRRIDILSGNPTPAPYKSIIRYLNSKTGKQYKHTSKNTQKLIKARINEGFTEEDFKHVINVKVEQWINDPKMSEYLRPTTLFGNKFDTYRNEISKEIADEDNPYLKYMNS